MRLWHYKLLPYLPNSQLIAQWRELNSIFKKQDKHILINYIYEYPKMDLLIYSEMVIGEMWHREYKLKTQNFENYFDDLNMETYNVKHYEPFKNHHTDRYLIQCFYNLQEKFDRGQKDFTKERYEELAKYVVNDMEKELKAYSKLKSIIKDKYNEIEKKLNARVDYNYELHLSQKQFLEELKEVLKNVKEN